MGVEFDSEYLVYHSFDWVSLKAIDECFWTVIMNHTWNRKLNCSLPEVFVWIFTSN